VIPSRADPTVWRAANGVGGPWGRHAGLESWWTPLRWLLALTMVTLLLGFAEKAPCAGGTLSPMRQDAHLCTSDVLPLWSGADLDSGAVPYRDSNVPYPVVSGAFIYVTAELTRGLHALHDTWPDVALFGVLTVLLLSLCGLIVTACTASTARGRPYDAAIVAASPLLLFHAFTAWDLLAMAFASGALLVWARGHPVLAGALIGLGAAAKLYPVLLLVAIWILAVRTRRHTDAGWATAAAALTWSAANLPLAFAYHGGWWHYYRASIDSDSSRTSLWGILKTLVSGSPADADVTSWSPPGVAVALAVTAVLLVVAWLGLRAPIRPRLAQLAFLCVLAYLLTSKHWAPSQSLWLLPLLALARPRWRLTLVWQFSEVLVWFLYLFVDISGQGSTRAVSYGWLAAAALARDVLLVVLAALVVQEMWHPELDVVRTNGVDDPGGGVFDGAPDYWDAPSALRR
jgi:uncharacterized membrane protein